MADNNQNNRTEIIKLNVIPVGVEISRYDHISLDEGVTYIKVRRIPAQNVYVYTPKKDITSILDFQA